VLNIAHLHVQKVYPYGQGLQLRCKINALLAWLYGVEIDCCYCASING
jgi:hypothetical protein